MHISEGILAPGTLAAGYVVAGGLAAIGLRRIRDREYPLIGVMTAAFFVASLLRVPAGPTSVHLTLNSLVGIVLGIRCFPAIGIALFLQAALFGCGGPATLGVNTVIMAVPGYLAGTWMRWGLRQGGSGTLAFATVLLIVCATAPKLLCDGLTSIGWIQTTISWPCTLAIGLVAAALLIGVERGLKGGRIFRWGFSAGAIAVIGSAALLFAVLAFAPLDRVSEREPFRDIARFAFVAHAPIVFIEGVIVAFVVRYLLTVKPALLRDVPTTPTSAQEP
ncbi:MAG: cobalt transporter CbiM [Phycisphaerae bacterium]|nr:cobalt transporter CbiM [Phycisphaerae bacterium]